MTDEQIEAKLKALPLTAWDDVWFFYRHESAISLYHLQIMRWEDAIGKLHKKHPDMDVLGFLPMKYVSGERTRVEIFLATQLKLVGNQYYTLSSTYTNSPQNRRVIARLTSMPASEFAELIPPVGESYSLVHECAQRSYQLLSVTKNLEKKISELAAIEQEFFEQRVRQKSLLDRQPGIRDDSARERTAEAIELATDVRRMLGKIERALANGSSAKAAKKAGKKTAKKAK